ncbi:MAG: hypothetical protein SWE60_14135 [Thermodesulfobacteriota bacterium]|nr:hypothetical protein [Thermodesulfobacteriota bacterium]
MDKKDELLDLANAFSGQAQIATDFPPYVDPEVMGVVSQSTGAAQVQVAEDLGLKSEVQSLRKQVQEIQAALGKRGVEPWADAIELRDIPYARAKEEIAEYFEAHHGEDVDAADLQEALGIELSTAIRVCEELAEEGKIKALS